MSSDTLSLAKHILETSKGRAASACSPGGRWDWCGWQGRLPPPSRRARLDRTHAIMWPPASLFKPNLPDAPALRVLTEGQEEEKSKTFEF